MWAEKVKAVFYYLSVSIFRARFDAAAPVRGLDGNGTNGYCKYVVSTLTRKRSTSSRRLASGRVNLRVDPRVKALLVRAARLQQVKLTEFMVRSCQAAAENVLAERTRFVLAPEKWREFNAALDAPARRLPALQKLFSGPSVFEPA